MIEKLTPEVHSITSLKKNKDSSPGTERYLKSYVGVIHLFGEQDKGQRHNHGNDTELFQAAHLPSTKSS
jgi:hypothetical protein